MTRHIGCEQEPGRASEDAHMSFRAPLRQTIRYFLPRIYTLIRHSGGRRSFRQVCAMVPGILLVIPAYAGADAIIFSNLGVSPSNRRDGYIRSCCAPTTCSAPLGDGLGGLRPI